MIQPSLTRKFLMVSLIAAILTIPPRSHAVTILFGPTFTPATSAPLAGLLQLTTDVPSRISVRVSDGTTLWEHGFGDFGILGENWSGAEP